MIAPAHRVRRWIRSRVRCGYQEIQSLCFASAGLRSRSCNQYEGRSSSQHDQLDTTRRSISTDNAEISFARGPEGAEIEGGTVDKLEVLSGCKLVCSIMLLWNVRAEGSILWAQSSVPVICVDIIAECERGRWGT